jgi:hypothetical protein
LGQVKTIIAAVLWFLSLGDLLLQLLVNTVLSQNCLYVLIILDFLIAAFHVVGRDVARQI